jgi:hypothetical protein
MKATQEPGKADQKKTSKTAGVSLPQLVKTLNLDRSSVSRRAKDAQSKGYLANEEAQPGKPARWVVGEPLPEDVEVLPPPEKLDPCSVVEEKGDTQNSGYCDGMLPITPDSSTPSVAFNSAMVPRLAEKPPNSRTPGPYRKGIREFNRSC